jgi:hypothetical protein
MSSLIFGGQPESFEIQAAATAPLIGPSRARSWLEQKHPVYAKMCDRWQHVHDFYLGEVADPHVAQNYLIRRYQGESDQAYSERVRTSDYTPHLGTVIDSLAGILFGKEDRTTRVWTGEKGTDGLGDPAKEGTPANRLWQDADGYGTGWKTLWREFTLDIIAYQYMWVLVDTTYDAGPHVVKLVDPRLVPNWKDAANGAIDVLMCDHKDTRLSIQDEVTPGDGSKRFIRWLPTGFERWILDKEGKAIQDGGLTSYGKGYVDRNKQPTLPIFRVELPIRRYVAWVLSRKAQSVFNQESVRDFGLRISNFPKLVIGAATDTQFQGIKNRLQTGENVLPEDKEATGAHRYINPSSEPTVNASTVLDKKVEHFWASAFQMYADSAREKTATEVRQDVASGVGACCQLIAAAVDDAENGAFWRLEQAEFADSESKWGVSKTERTDDFATVDMGLVLDQMRKRYLGETDVIPIGRGALIQMAKDAAGQDGLPVNQAEIEAAVDLYLLNKISEPLALLNVTPAMIKARIAMKLVAAAGLIDEEEMLEMSEGDKQKLFDVMLAQAEDLANTLEEQQRRMSELPPFGGAEGGGEPKPKKEMPF